MICFCGESYTVAMLAAGHVDLSLEPTLQLFDIVALIRSASKRAASSRA
jgi:fructose-1,6-bisphosphatase/inositol monophosphatase family enzyme